MQLILDAEDLRTLAALARRRKTTRVGAVREWLRQAWAERVGLDGQRRWLIGQALHGIATVGAPHGVVHKFAAEMAAP